MRLLIGFLLGAAAVFWAGIQTGLLDPGRDLCPQLPAAWCAANSAATPPAVAAVPDQAAAPEPPPTRPPAPPPTTPVAAASPADTAAPPPAAPASGRTALPIEFRSQVSADGFARHLAQVTGAQFTTERRGAGRYAVTYRWANAAEQQAIADAIAVRIGTAGQG